MDITELYRRLISLHSKLDSINKGDHPYHQFYYLYRLNGAGCPTLIPLSKMVDLKLFEEELKNVVSAYREYRANIPNA